MTRSGSLLCCLTLLHFVGNCNGAFAAEPRPAKVRIPENPFAYCSRVATADSPAGGSSPVPPALAPYLARALGLHADVEFTAESYYWRCMDGAVYVCAIGANLPCDAKADRAKRNEGAENYCREYREAACDSSAQTPAFCYFTDLRPLQHDSPDKETISLADLMSMSSALDCDDNDDNSVGSEDRMHEQQNWTRWGVDLPTYAGFSRDIHGLGSWRYCTINAVLAGRCCSGLRISRLITMSSSGSLRHSASSTGSGRALRSAR